MTSSMIAAALRGSGTLPDEAQLRARMVHGFLEAAGVHPDQLSDETLEEAYLLADRMLFEAAQRRLSA